MEKTCVKWGVLGTAGIAWEQTLPGMKKAYNCELYAIAGRNPEKVKKYQEEFGFEKAYDSYDALLDDEQVEAVYTYRFRTSFTGSGRRKPRKRKSISFVKNRLQLQLGM